MNRLNIFKKTKPEIKVILLGDSGVGKTTSLINIRDNDIQQENTETKISKTTTIIDTIYDNTNPEFNIVYYDTAGQERFQSIIPSYFRNIDIVLLVFNIMNTESYRTAINVWLEIIKEHNTDSSYKVFMIANKIDLLETSLDHQRLNDPHIYAIDNDITFKLLSKDNLDLYSELKKDITETAKSILKSRKELARKELTGKVSNYLSYKYWFPQEKEKEKNHFDEIFKEIYEENKDEELQETNNCCTIM